MKKDTVTNLPIKPMIAEVEIVRHKGKLKGAIKEGEVFAWEPDLPWARELLIVTSIETREDATIIIHTKDMNYENPAWNTERKFRESAQRTRFRNFPTKKFTDPLPWHASE